MTMHATPPDLLAKYQQAKERCEIERQINEWIIDLRSRIGDRWHRFESRDCTIKPDDLVLEMERLRLTILLARRCRR